MINKQFPRVANDAKKCCGEIPVLMQPDGRKHEYIVICQRCGRKTLPSRQYWIAEMEWNCGNTLGGAKKRQNE